MTWPQRQLFSFTIYVLVCHDFFDNEVDIGENLRVDIC